MKPLKELMNMVGQEFVYKSNNITIKYIDVQGELFIITTTTGKIIKMPQSEVVEFIEECLPVDRETGVMLITPEEKKDLEKIRDILFDNIEKVQKDAKYIPQAQAINKNINSVISLYSVAFKAKQMNKK